MQHKETPLNSSKAFIQPVLHYACPVCTPAAANTHIELQNVQNLALSVHRVHENDTKVHLYNKCEVSPVLQTHSHEVCPTITSSPSDLAPWRTSSETSTYAHQTFPLHGQ